MRVDCFDFELPEERIADRPASPRDAARLLEVRPKRIADHVVRDLPALLRPGDLLVVNDTRVIPARIEGRRGDVKVELTLLKALDDGRWTALARPARRLKPGQVVEFAPAFSAIVEERRAEGEVVVSFRTAGRPVIAALEEHGAPPLPPYIATKRPIDSRDVRDYQTIFARRPGAVAAPTAGLHFTPELISRLEEAGIEAMRVTLHVGAGTFLPVKVADTTAHRMHAEAGEITAAAASRIAVARAAGGRIVAVGTTALRLLESATDEAGVVRPWRGETDIFITPGFRFRAVDLVITNFHLPRSTLFMLVAAFSGLEQMKRAYAHAIAKEYRFYSYGDCCLLHPATS